MDQGFEIFPLAQSQENSARTSNNSIGKKSLEDKKNRQKNIDSYPYPERQPEI